MKALVLAAGLGTRLAPFTDFKPKPLISVFGLPIIYYSLFLLRQSRIQNLVVNLHHLPEQIQKLFLNPDLSDFKVQFSLEKEKPLGSGGALSHAQSLLNDVESFFVINADEVMLPENDLILSRLQEHHENTQSLATFLVMDHPDLLKTLKPIWVDDRGLVLGFGEKPPRQQNCSPVHFTGYKIYHRRIFDYLPIGESHIFKDAVIPAIQKGERISVLKIKAHWWETGNFKNLLETHKTLIEMIHSSPEKNPLKPIFSSFSRRFNYKTVITPELQMAHPEDTPLKPTHFKNTIFIGTQATVSDSIHLNNVIVEPGGVVEISTQDTIII